MTDKPFWQRFPHSCSGIVVRDGIEEACEKVAVGVVAGKWEGEWQTWPACPWHLNRWHNYAMPLTEILRAGGDR